MNNTTLKKEKTYIDSFNPETLLYTDEFQNMASKFKCGESIFDYYLLKEALRNRLSGDGVTYIVREKDKQELIAYYTLSTSTVHFIDTYTYEDDDVPTDEKRKYYSPIGAVIINMFAVNNDYQDCIYNGEVVSAKVLQSIIAHIYKMSIETIGAKMIILCSVPTAVEFYKKNNFKELLCNYTLFDHIDLRDNKAMYLPMHEV